MRATVTFIFVICISKIQSDYVDPELVVVASKGEVWPKPQFHQKLSSVLELNAQKFTFKATGQNCNSLQSAFKRYVTIIQLHEKIIASEKALVTSGSSGAVKARKSTKRRLRKRRAVAIKSKKLSVGSKDDENVLKVLNVQLNGPCRDTEYPYFNMDEAYILNITTETKTLTSFSYWGVLRGLETFSQLIYRNENRTKLIINQTHIYDYPRFAHRGLLLDTSRHFIPTNLITQIIEAMAFNKLNVFHWHITDDHSFPYKSTKFPELSAKGSYHPQKMVYQKSDIEKIIQFAKERGIRVIAEFDTPAHTRSWGEAMKDLLTTCYLNNEPTIKLGPINPIPVSTYEFLESFFQEVAEIFSDNYIHLGGNEVDFSCWKSNPNITEFMNQMGFMGNYYRLENYYMQRLLNIVAKFKANPIVWEEVFLNKVDLPNNAIVQVWKPFYKLSLYKIAKEGHNAILSSCWNLSNLAPGGDWKKFYKCDPHDFYSSSKLKNFISGGEVCMWGDHVNEHNVLPRIWPRASAVAEKLWAPLDDPDSPTVTDQEIEDAAVRLEEHTCRMISRGIPAQPPNGAGFCF